jgi:hypothetical protein
MASLVFFALFASSVTALRHLALPASQELKISEGEADNGVENGNAVLQEKMEAELDQEERAYESALFKSYESSVSQICTEDIMYKKMEHAECADPWAKTQVCENAYEIPSYRLGDTFYEDHSAIPEFTQFYFPESIATKYLKSKSKKHDLPAMLKLIEGPEYAHYEKPAADTVVVHLRLGDALLRNKDYLLRNDTYYNKAAKRMLKNNIKSVVLVTGDHKIKQRATLTGAKHYSRDSDSMEKMTKERVQHIEKLFQKNGLTVSKRINYNADCDLVYMANSHSFLQAGGRYSSLISELVRSKGGEVLGKN